MAVEPTEDQVLSWGRAKCKECGFTFPKSEEWATRCIICFKKGKNYNRVIADNAFLWAQHELARVDAKLKETQQELAAAGRAPPPPPRTQTPQHLPPGAISAELLRELIKLCHPDKHDNDERATRVTRELLTLRDQKTK